MAEKWVCKSHVKKYEYPLFTLWEDRIVPPGEAERTYSYIEHPPSVMIVAVNERSEYFLVRQYRYPIRQDSWEFPAGNLEGGEDPREAVKRELQEEINFTALNLTRLGQITSNSSMSSETCEIFLARDLTPASQDRDPTEHGMVVKAVPLAEIEEMVRQGHIKESSTIAALTFLKLYLSSNG